MTKPTKVTTPATPKTIAWFEQAITAATPTTGILASVDQGIWSIAETSGQLAGIWRRHRNQMQDLDDGAVTQALGELLAAIVQTAHAIGVPLETIMTEQAERMRKIRHDTVARKTKPHPTTPAREMVEHTSRQSRPRTRVKQPKLVPVRPSLRVQQMWKEHMVSASASKTGQQADTPSVSEERGKRHQVNTESRLVKPVQNRDTRTPSVVPVGSVTAHKPGGSRLGAAASSQEKPVTGVTKQRAKKQTNVRIP